MSITSDIKDRIFAAADRLYADAGRESFPTVDAVRREAKTDMNAASAAMKEWRKAQTATPVSVAVAVPEAIGKAAGELIANVWMEAQALANASLHTAEAAWAVERAEADDLRSELAEAHDTQTREIDGLAQRLATAELEAQKTAELHQVEVKGLQELHQGAEKSLHETRETLAETKGRLEGVSAELVRVEGALTKAEQALSMSEQLSAQLEAQLQAQRDKNAELLAQMEQATYRANQAEAQVETQRLTLVKAEQTTQAAHEKIQEIDGQLRTLQMHNAKVEGKTEALEQQLVALHKTLEKQSQPEPQPKV